MMRLRFVVLLLPGACGAAPTEPTGPTSDPWFARFADAMEFVPDGMSSHWFSDHRGVPPFAGQPAPQFVTVRCARNFQPPHAVGVGVYDGVEIEDYGAQPIPDTRRAEFKQAQPAIDGIDVWSYAETSPALADVPFRAAVVDQRFVVVATSEELLRQALQRRGAPRFGSLEPLPAIDPATVDLVVRDLTGQPMPRDALLPLNAPDISAVAALISAPWRVRTWGRNEVEVQGLSRYCFQHHFSVRRLDASGGLHIFEGTPLESEDEDAQVPTRAWLGLGLFFGWWIFV